MRLMVRMTVLHRTAVGQNAFLKGNGREQSTIRHDVELKRIQRLSPNHPVTSNNTNNAQQQ